MFVEINQREGKEQCSSDWHSILHRNAVFPTFSLHRGSWLNFLDCIPYIKNETVLSSELPSTRSISVA